MESLEEIQKIQDMHQRIKALEEREKELRKRGSISYLADISWSKISSQKDWERAKKEALTKYLNGQFFVERIGRYKEMDPEFMAVLVCLRRQWIQEYKLRTIPEIILLDFTLISWHHFIRTNYEIGNLQALLEKEFFLEERPRLEYDGYYYPDSLWIENRIKYLVEVLLPTLDRYNRMFLRNLKAIRDLKRSNQILNVGNVNQINIGEKQVNIGK